MGGGIKKAEQTSESITQQQLDLAKEQQKNAEQDRAQRIELTQPAIDFNKAIASGDKQSMMTAIAPMLAQITGAGKAAKENIFEGTAPGAARDVSLASVDRGVQSDIAGTVNNTFLGSLDKLANIGSGVGSFSLNEIGAALSGFGGAAGTNRDIMQAESAKKASTMGFLGNLAGAAGTAYAGK